MPVQTTPSEDHQRRQTVLMEALREFLNDQNVSHQIAMGALLSTFVDITAAYPCCRERALGALEIAQTYLRSAPTSASTHHH